MRYVIFSLVVVILAHSLQAGTPVCELYVPGHFGNWYEVAGEDEMRRILIEAKTWGYNRYGDWFNTLDCVNPFSGDKQYSLGNALWDRKKVHFRTAQRLGLQTDLIITPNHVYRDQLKAERIAQTGGRVFGQLICPHKPGAREVILNNHRQLLADLAAAGIRLTAITAAPYDYGGCNCDRCQPWILTFADLVCEIHKIAQTYHPGIELHFIGWWWSAEEHRRFTDWMDQNAPNIAQSVALHIPYDKNCVAEVPLPKNCKRHAFVHIGYAEESEPRDVYGRTGPVIAARRLMKTVQNLKKQSVSGVVAYSEGIFDDVNKALLAGLFTDRFESSEEVIQAYAKRYFAANEVQANQWLNWLLPWGKPFNHDASVAGRSFRGLCGEPSNWRRRQWELKADMFVAHHAIGVGDDWTPDRLAHAEEFWDAYETLQRSVYGVGPLRHSLGPSYIGLTWYKSWTQHRHAVATQPNH
ncbi:MAG: hypothetical protein JSV03_08800 [Planctomycetota bacterium]|nr:MAG: hypothetical protein JSV03_08800 [Planctomycetota bacterium]